MTAENALDDQVVEVLRRHGLIAAGETPRAERLTGGVSSEIWKVETDRGAFCVKRALAKLAVAQDWFAPVERNLYERKWYAHANRIVPGAAPKILAADDDAMLFAMEYLPPANHRLWKSELADGRVDPAFAAAVGRSLAAIHAATAGDPAIAADFPTIELFEALRLEPYLRATAERHPALAARLNALADHHRTARIALVHGDVSPKNILIGPNGPVFLDAECACLSDPAFDLAFCLNHMLLKAVWHPADAGALLASFDALAGAWLAGVTWEAAEAAEARVAALLPALFLARIDGKSPVEYLTTEDQRALVRRVSIPLIEVPPARLSAIRTALEKELST